MIIDEEYLEHYGKKGMRWGHRRTGAQRLAIGAAAVAGFEAGNRGLAKYKISTLTHLGLSLAASYAAVKTTKYLIDTYGDQPIPNERSNRYG